MNFQTLEYENIEVLCVTILKLFRFQNAIDLKKKKEKTSILTISQQVQDKTQKLKDSPYRAKGTSNRLKRNSPYKNL